jgi:hypothetical protein
MQECLIDRIIYFWTEYGFIRDEVNKRNMSLSLELTKIYLNDDQNNDKYKDIDSMIFPVVYRILKHITDDLSINTIFEKVVNICDELILFMDTHQHTFSELNSIPGVDAEAELLALFCGYYIRININTYYYNL